MYKVLLINPHFLRKKQRYSKLTYHYYPSGLVYIASNLPKEKYEVKILDLFTEELSEKEFIKLVIRFGPSFVGISSYTENIVSAFEIANLLKKIDSSIKIILGGPHASALPERTLQESNNIDFIITGEGEEKMVDLLELLCINNETVKSDRLCRQERKVINNPYQFIDNLDTLSFPEWDFLKLNKYRPLIKLKDNSPELPLITQRGCPYSCTFCYDIHGKNIRQRSIVNIIKEINYNLIRLHVKSFAILDEVFTFDRDRTINFCHSIINSGINKLVTFGCSTRADLLDKDLILIMKRAGFNRIMIGVESASKATLKRMNKSIPIDTMINNIRFLKLNSILTHASIIIGYPFETKNDIKKTIKFAKSLSPDYVSINILFPYPGTEIFNEIIKERGFQEFSWIKFSQNIGIPFHLNNIKNSDLRRYQFFGYMSFYCNLFKLINLIKTFGIRKLLKVYLFRNPE